MFADQWRVIVAWDDAATRKAAEEEKQTPEKQRDELDAVVLLFHAFLNSEDAKAAAKMCDRFFKHVEIVEIGCAEKGTFFDVFGAEGFGRRLHKLGAEGADPVESRPSRDVIADWMSKLQRRAYEFLPWLFAELEEINDEATAEVERRNKVREERRKAREK